MKPTVEIFTNVNELQSLIMHIFVYFMRRAGMEDLSNTVRVRRLTLAGHIPRAAATIRQASKFGYAVGT